MIRTETHTWGRAAHLFCFSQQKNRSLTRPLLYFSTPHFLPLSATKRTLPPLAMDPSNGTDQGPLKLQSEFLSGVEGGGGREG